MEAECMVRVTGGRRANIARGNSGLCVALVGACRVAAKVREACGAKITCVVASEGPDHYKRGGHS